MLNQNRKRKIRKKKELMSFAGIFGESEADELLQTIQKSRINKELPFEIRIPNKTTLKTFQDTDNRRDIIRCKNTEEIFENLGI